MPYHTTSSHLQISTCRSPACQSSISPPEIQRRRFPPSKEQCPFSAMLINMIYMWIKLLCLSQRSPDMVKTPGSQWQQYIYIYSIFQYLPLPWNPNKSVLNNELYRHYSCCLVNHCPFPLILTLPPLLSYHHIVRAHILLIRIRTYHFYL